jgi:hypothetical protein
MCRRTLLVALALLIVSASRAADLRTLKNETFKGDLVAVTDKEIVFSKGGDKVTLPVTQVLFLDFGPPGKIAPDVKYADLELTDGTRLHCKELTLKPKLAQITLLDDSKMEVPLAAVSNILFTAHVAAHRKDLNERVAKKRTKDILVLDNMGTPNGIPVALGEASEDGKTITFTAPGETKERTRPVEGIQGLIYNRYLPPDAPTVKAKLTDTAGNLVMVSGQSLGDDGLTVTTPSGVKFVYPLARLARLDYGTGNVAYLSDMTPTHVKMESTEDRVDRFRLDRNLDDTGPLRIKTEEFAKGLAVHSYTELEYDLRGEYRAFSCTAGFDDNIGGHPGPVVLTIEGDGRELKKVTLDRKDKPKPEQISVNVKDVQKLRIVVSSGDLLDLGKHLDLGDAKVSK